MQRRPLFTAEELAEIARADAEIEREEQARKNEKNRAWIAQNREKRRAQDARYREKNREKIRAAARESYHKRKAEKERKQ